MERETQKAQTRARVLQAARACFAELGFERTTISAVARRAGVSVGTVHLHFVDKSTLVLSCFHDDLGRVIRQAMATLPERDLVAQLLHLAAGLYRWYAEDPQLGTALVRESLFVTGPMAEPMGAQALGFMASVAQLTQQAIDRGEVAPVPVDVVGQGFFADYFLVLTGGLQGHLPTVEHQLEALGALTRLRLRPLGEDT